MNGAFAGAIASIRGSAANPSLSGRSGHEQLAQRRFA
jgi:hypothetical protein